MRRIMIAYVPVLHAGYLNLFEKYAHKVECLYVFGDDFIGEFTYLTREIRALSPEVAVKMIESLKMFPKDGVHVLDKNDLFLMKKIREKIVIVTSDEMSRKFVEKYMPGQQLVVETPFLRWDEKSVNSSTTVNFDWKSLDPHDREMMQMAQKEAGLASCWWRHVGAVLVNPQTGQVILAAHNRHMPSEHAPYAVGDPRDFVKAGTNPELASTIHAEPTIIAMAARDGIALKGMHLYITVFPCGPCASIVAESGISRLYFASGCAYLDGEGVLRSRGVEIVHVA